MKKFCVFIFFLAGAVYGLQREIGGLSHFSAGNLDNVSIDAVTDTFFLRLDYDSAKLCSSWLQCESIPIPTRFPAMLIYNDKFYIFGGDTGDVSSAIILNTVQRCEVKGDSMKNWEVLNRQLPVELSGMGFVKCGGYFYLLGGGTNTGISNKVYYTRLEGDSFGEWRETTPLPVALRFMGVATDGERIFVGGGNDGASVRKELYCAKVLADGSLSDWIQLRDLPVAAYFITFECSKGYLYVTGGTQDPGMPYNPVNNKVYYAKILNDTISFWDSTYIFGSPNDTGRVFHWMSSTGNALLIYGGVYIYDLVNYGKLTYFSTLRAMVSPAGTLSAWDKYPPSQIAAPRGDDYRGYLYCTNGANPLDLGFRPLPYPYATEIVTSSNYCSTGVFVSPIIDIGDVYTIMFAIPDFNANGQEIYVSYRTAKDATNWCDWEEKPLTDTVSIVKMGRYFQYKLKFVTKSADLTPVFRKLRIYYSLFDPSIEQITLPSLLKMDTTYIVKVTVKNNSQDIAQTFKVKCEIYENDSLIVIDTQDVLSLPPLNIKDVDFVFNTANKSNIVYKIKAGIIVNPEANLDTLNDCMEKEAVSIGTGKSDVEALFISYPSDSVPRSVGFCPSFIARNNGDISVSALAECFIFEGATKIYTDSTLVVGLLPGEEREIKFKEWIPQNVGTYTIKVKVNMGDNLDTNTTNDSLTSTFYVREPRVDAFPVSIKVTEIPPNVSCTVKTSVAQNGEIEATIPVEFILKDLQLHEIVRDSQNILLDANDTGEVKFVFTSPSDTGNYIAYLITNLPEDINHANDTLSETIKVVSLGENLPSGVKLQVTNPAGKELVVKFSAKTGEEVKINMYDVNGRKVKEVFGGKSEKSSYVIKLNIEDLPSGVYFVKMTTPQHKLIRKVVIIK